MGDQCREYVEALYVYLDGELSITQRRVIQEHLSDCPPCDEAFAFEDHLRRLVASKCRDQVPEALRLRIQAILESGGEPPSQAERSNF
jgi:mycothiol system anti-sigma-R factor